MVQGVGAYRGPLYVEIGFGGMRSQNYEIVSRTFIQIPAVETHYVFVSNSSFNYAKPLCPYAVVFQLVVKGFLHGAGRDVLNLRAAESERLVSG